MMLLPSGNKTPSSYYVLSVLFAIIVASASSSSFFFVAGQGCSNRCPPLNYGVVVPALCEGDYIDGDTNIDGQNVRADIDRLYDVCYPSNDDDDGPKQFKFEDFRGPSNTVTVIANYYTGCNAGRRESGVFAHVAQRYYDQYGPDKVHFVQSVKGGGTCDQWSSIYQRDAKSLYPTSNVVPNEMPWSVDDSSYSIRDELFTSPFGHPAYVVLDGNLQIKHKFIGPCCGYERYSDCTPDIARTLDTTLSEYLDEILLSSDNFVDDGQRPNVDIVSSEEEKDDYDYYDYDYYEDGAGKAEDVQVQVPPIDLNYDCNWSDWSPCSVRCGPTPGKQFRYIHRGCASPFGEAFDWPLFESRTCASENTNCNVEDGGSVPCVPEIGEQYTIATIHDGFDSPRDVKFHPTPGYNLGNSSEGRTFVHPDGGDEAWIINGNNHTISIVTAVGHPEHQSSIPRRDRGYYHYMINGTAISFNTVTESGRRPDRDTVNYWAICNDNSNDYIGKKENNNFMGPTLYDSSPDKRNLVNKMGEICSPEKHEDCFFLHSDMLHESPSCRGIVHDPELETSYGAVYWAFDSTGNNNNGQLVRFDFQQPHGPGSMDHSIASVRRYVEVELESTDVAKNHAGIHAGMVIHPTNRHLYVSVPGNNHVLKVDIDSGRFARTAREEYPIFSNRLPSFEYSIWECVDRVVYADNIDTPSGLAFSSDYERLFVAERGTGSILIYDVDTGDLLRTIRTGFNTIGGMEISPNGGELYFVDDETGTLNSISVEVDCGSQIYALRTDPQYLNELGKAKLALGIDDPYTLLKDTCTVDPIVPNVTFFDQVHVDTGYASDNPDVQSNHTGMDEQAALLANRTDCEYDSELNFDALLLGGYFCHVCLPEQESTCQGGGKCTNVQWDGYICDNEFQIVDNTNPDLPGTYRIQTLNGTDIDSTELVLKPGVEYRFQIEVEEEVCLSTLREIRPPPSRDENKIGTVTAGVYSPFGRQRQSGSDYNNDVTLESVDLGCGTKTAGPLIFNAGEYELTGPQIYVNIGFGTEPVFAMGMEMAYYSDDEEQQQEEKATASNNKQYAAGASAAMNEEIKSSASSSTTTTVVTSTIRFALLLVVAYVSGGELFR